MTAPTEQSILAFLNGEGPLDGKHFGEKDERGHAFWWRKYLPALARRIEAEAVPIDPEAWVDDFLIPTRANTIAFYERRQASCRLAATAKHRSNPDG